MTLHEILRTNKLKLQEAREKLAQVQRAEDVRHWRNHINGLEHIVRELEILIEKGSATNERPTNEENRRAEGAE